MSIPKWSRARCRVPEHKKTSQRKTWNLNDPSECSFSPLPLPFVNQNSGDVDRQPSSPLVRWPLRTPGVLLFSGLVNEKEKCVEVLDRNAVRLLYDSGFFGLGDQSRAAVTYSLVDVDSDFLGESLDDPSMHKIPDALEKLLENDDFQHLSDEFLLGDLQNPYKIPNSVMSGSDSNNEDLDDDDDDVDGGTSPLNKRSKTDIEDGNDSDEDAKERIPHERLIAISSKLRLTFEEAFFLSYALGSLVVYRRRSDEQPLDLLEMWCLYSRLFNAKDLRHFSVHYFVYHHFRSRGWIVKSGIKYATHFVLYRDGPPFSHGLHSLTIIKRSASGLETLDDTGDHPMSWEHFQAVCRVSSTVKKEPILCYVTLPEDIVREAAEEFLSRGPSVIAAYDCDTIHAFRWKSSRDVKLENVSKND